MLSNNGMSHVAYWLKIPVATMTHRRPLFPQHEAFHDWCLVVACAQQQEPGTTILGLACRKPGFRVFSGHSLELTQQ